MHTEHTVWASGPVNGEGNGYGPDPLTLSMKEAKRLFRVLIWSFSWVRTTWIRGSMSTLTGARRLLLTVTGVMVWFV